MLTLSLNSDDQTTSTVSRKQSNQFLESGPIITETDDVGASCQVCTNCPGFTPHSFRRTCQACKCLRIHHDIYKQEMTTAERIGFKSDLNGDLKLQLEAKQLGYAWIPPGIISSAKIQSYFDKFPSDKVPELNTKGEQYRNKMIAYQIPKQDLSLKCCKYIEEDEIASYEDFISARNEIALDIGFVKDVPKDQATVCKRCSKHIQQSELAVIAPKLREQTYFHPTCFTCVTCDELLVDLTYCLNEDEIYCERHYAETMKPRCNACDEDSDHAARESQTQTESVSTGIDESLSPDPPKKRSKRDLCMTPDEEADEAILQLDIEDNNDPELSEMVDYVRKLANSEHGPGLVKATDDENVIEYYWKPQVNAVPTDSEGLQSWESSDDISSIRKPREKSFSIAYDSAKYGRRQSLAETIIIPKTVKDNYDADSLVSLEKEAEDYKYVWGIEVPNVQPLANIRTKHVSSRRHSVAFESPKYSRLGRRRTSLAETMIIPKSVQSGYDFSTFVQMEQEGEEYNRLWGLNAEENHDEPSDAEAASENDLVPSLPQNRKIPQRHISVLANSLPTMSEEEYEISAPKPPSRLRLRRTSAQIDDLEAPTKRRSKSHSISMGILSRRKLLTSNRRPSIADLAIIPRTVSEDLDEATMALLDNEALAYKMAFPDIEIPIKDNDDNIPLEMNISSDIQDAQNDTMVSIVESRTPTPHEINYNEWYNKFSDQKTSHIETTFSDDDDEEVTKALSLSFPTNEIPEVKNHIFYTFPANQPPLQSQHLQRPTTPADYNEYMQKFPDQLSPDIVVEGRQSPATLEMYLKEMESPRLMSSAGAAAKSPVPSSAPPTLEVYLERLRSKSPSPMPKTD